MANSTYHPIAFLRQYELKDAIKYQCETFDIIYILSGDLTVKGISLDSVKYHANDIFTMTNDQIYEITPGKNNIFIHLGLNVSYMEDYNLYSSQIVCNSQLEPNRNYIPLRNIITSIVSSYFDDGLTNNFTLLSYVFSLFSLLQSDYTILNKSVINSNRKSVERISQINEYIRDNYKNALSLNNLAGYLNLSPTYISKIFKEYYGVSFVQYINHYRIERALNDIKYTKLPIIEIAARNGYPNISTFNRQFKEIYKSSPHEFRLSEEKNKPASASWINHDTSDELLFISQTSNRYDIVVSADSCYRSKRNFTTLMNVGYAPRILSLTMQEHIKIASKELGFTYVRIQGLISNAMIPRLTTTGKYHFAQVDELLSFLYSNHLIPFIELGKDPFEYISGTAVGNVSKRSLRNRKRFFDMFEAFLIYVRDTNNPSWTKNWCFELWRHPDESFDEYIKVYEKILSLIRKYLPETRFGGPGHMTSTSPESFIKIMKVFATKGIEPDFISLNTCIIQYVMGPKRNPDMYQTNRNLKQIQNWAKNMINQIFNKSLPLYITEFNTSLVPQTFINESCFQATYIIKELLDAHNDTEMIGYWMLDDNMFTVSDLYGYMLNGISLINKLGIATPAYHAYSFLNRLGTHIIEQAKNYCISKTDENHFQIIAYNYAHITNIDSLANAATHSLLDTYSYFENVPPFQISFTINDINPGVYKIKRYILNREHGSHVDILIGGLFNSSISEEEYLYKMLTPNKNDSKYLESTCIPEERTIFERASTSLTVSTPLHPYSVCFYEIVREL